MANSHGTINNGRLIAQEALGTLLTKFPALGKIARNYSNEPIRFGETLIAHVPAAAEAVDFNPANGYVASAVSQVDVPVVLNQHIHHTYKVGVQERSSSNIDLIRRYANVSAHAIGKKMYDALFGVVLAADYAGETVVDPEDFDRSDVVDIGTALNTRDVLDVDRLMILNSALYGELLKDITIVGNNTNPSGQIVSGILSDVHGFEVSHYSAMPSNDETLVGVALVPEALAVVTSIPEAPEQTQGGSMQIVTEPNSGLSVMLRQWYDWKMSEEYRTLTLFFGVAKGHTPNLERLVTTAQS